MRHLLAPMGLACLFAIIASAATAQVKDQSFKDWTVYTTTLEGQKTCYMLSYPKSKTGNYKRRDDPYFLVTRRSDNVDEVSTSSGYKYKSNSDVNVDIDGGKYKMFTQGELAWAPDSQKDAAMVQAMKKKNDMKVRGTSTVGTYSVDKYSLSGFTAAYKRMHSVCN